MGDHDDVPVEPVEISAGTPERIGAYGVRVTSAGGVRPGKPTSVAPRNEPTPKPSVGGFGVRVTLTGGVAQATGRRRRRANQNRSPAGECGPETIRCSSARSILKPTNDCCRKWNEKILGDLATLLDRDNVRWWIDYGTVLGFVANGGLFWNDKDTDIGVLSEDREKVLALQRELRAMGYTAAYSNPRPARFSGGDRMKVRLSRINHTNCDVFFWERKPHGILDRNNYIQVDLNKGREFPEKWALPVVRGKWEGIDVAVPAMAAELVAHRYGEDWRERIPMQADLAN